MGAPGSRSPYGGAEGFTVLIPHLRTALIDTSMNAQL
jgi:hypothetical protein